MRNLKPSSPPPVGPQATRQRGATVVGGEPDDHRLVDLDYENETVLLVNEKGFSDGKETRQICDFQVSGRN
jgi:hypothetical protein